MAERYTSDLADVLRWVEDDPELGGGEIALYAFSFSTWVALSVLRRLDRPPAALVCDSGPMFDIGAGLQHFARVRKPTLPEAQRGGAGHAVYRSCFSLLCRRMLAVRNWPPDLSGTPTRLMFVAGGQDQVVPESQIAPVADRYARAERWTAPNALHMSALRFDREEYQERVLTFLTGAFAHPTRRSEAAKDG